MNDKTISKAQLEVWAWKEALHDEIKDMPLTEGLHHIIKKGSDYRKELEHEGKLPVHRSQKQSCASQIKE